MIVPIPTTSDLSKLSLEQLRQQREEFVKKETGLSYLRRLVQTPLDIALQSKQNKDLGNAKMKPIENIEEIVFERPGKIIESGRYVGSDGEMEINQELADEIDCWRGQLTLHEIETVEDFVLERFISEGQQLEQRISLLRKNYFEIIDRYQNEVVQRYTSEP